MALCALVCSLIPGEFERRDQRELSIALALAQECGIQWLARQQDKRSQPFTLEQNPPASLPSCDLPGETAKPPSLPVPGWGALCFQASPFLSDCLHRPAKTQVLTALQACLSAQGRMGRNDILGTGLAPQQEAEHSSRVLEQWRFDQGDVLSLSVCQHL